MLVGGAGVVSTAPLVGAAPARVFFLEGWMPRRLLEEERQPGVSDATTAAWNHCQHMRAEQRARIARVKVLRNRRPTEHGAKSAGCAQLACRPMPCLESFHASPTDSPHWQHSWRKASLGARAALPLWLVRAHMCRSASPGQPLTCSTAGGRPPWV